MRLETLSKKELLETQGGWLPLLVGGLIEAIREAIDNPDDFKAGFNKVKNR